MVVLQRYGQLDGQKDTCAVRLDAETTRGSLQDGVHARAYPKKLSHEDRGPEELCELTKDNHGLHE